MTKEECIKIRFALAEHNVYKCKKCFEKVKGFKAYEKRIFQAGFASASAIALEAAEDLIKE